MVATGRGAQAGVLSATPRRSSACAPVDTLVRRQDRHADRGQADARPASRRRSGFAEDEVLRLAASARAGQRAPARRRDRRAARERGLTLDQGARLRVGHRAGRAAARVDGRPCAARQCRADARQRGIASAPARRGCRATPRAKGETVMFARRSTASSPAASPSPIRSSRRRRRRSRRCTGVGLRVVMATGDNRTHGARRSREQLGIDDVARRGAARATSRADRRAAARRAPSSPWPATASTMRRRSPRPTSASPWAPAPTSRWRAPASRC